MNNTNEYNKIIVNNRNNRNNSYSLFSYSLELLCFLLLLIFLLISQCCLMRNVSMKTTTYTLCPMLLNYQNLLLPVLSLPSYKRSGHFALYNCLTLGHTKYKGVQRIYCNPFPRKKVLQNQQNGPCLHQTAWCTARWICCHS